MEITTKELEELVEKKAIDITYPLAFKRGQETEREEIGEIVEYILKPREKKGNKGRTRSREVLLKELLDKIKGARDKMETENLIMGKDKMWLGQFALTFGLVILISGLYTFYNSLTIFYYSFGQGLIFGSISTIILLGGFTITCIGMVHIIEVTHSKLNLRRER